MNVFDKIHDHFSFRSVTFPFFISYFLYMSGPSHMLPTFSYSSSARGPANQRGHVGPKLAHKVANHNKIPYECHIKLQNKKLFLWKLKKFKWKRRCAVRTLELLSINYWNVGKMTLFLNVRYRLFFWHFFFVWYK